MNTVRPRKQRGVFEKHPGSGIWWIVYYDANGQRHREQVGRYQAAVDAYYARKIAIREGRFLPPRSEPGTTFKSLLAEAFADRKTRLAPGSYASDEARSKLLLEWFGPLPAARISKSMIAERLRQLRHEGRSGPTVNRYKALLSALFTWGMENDKVPENPARGVKGYRDSERRVRYLDDDEEQALREAVQERCAEFEPELDIALHTGMRRNELYRLPWTDVDLKRLILTVHGKAHANSTESRVRYVPINSEAASAFEKLHQRARGSAYVCAGFHASEQGRAANPDERDRREWFENSLARAGIDNFRYHDLRHTFASRLVMNGVPLQAVMEYLGHSSINMVLRYAHLAPKYQRAGIETLARKAKRRAGPVLVTAIRRSAKKAKIAMAAGSQQPPEQPPGNRGKG